MYNAVAPPDEADGNKAVEAKPPAGVSESNWKKFQRLKKRREQYCKESTEKRRWDRRKKVIKPVSSEIQGQDELAILREYGIATSSSDVKVCHRSTQNIKNEAKWKDLKQYLPHTSNSNFVSQETGILRKQTEAEIDKAIKKGQYEKAESLSEQLVNQEFATKVASAVQGRDFSKRRSEQQIKAQKKKKTKLQWGFEQKQRWESKGNM